MSQNELIASICAAVGSVLVFWLFVSALRKARARRRAEFTETPFERREAQAIQPERELIELPLAPPDEAPPAVDLPALATPHTPDAALQAGLAKTSNTFLSRFNALFARGASVDPAVLDGLEDVLLTSDVGVKLTTRWVDELRLAVKNKKITDADELRLALKERTMLALTAGTPPIAPDGVLLPQSTDAFAAGPHRPKVILFVGVNGVGKTTTIGKIASQLSKAGQSVVLAAGDTFRAAAVQQLSIWGERSGARVIGGDANTDPASVVYNAILHAKETGADTVLADTAGRLHTKVELMDEIKKVKRAAAKAREGAPDETWLVVDATTGQNALQQAREFHDALGLTGVILTKLDGTAKGGVVVAIADALHIPVRFIGIGEKADDLRPFDAQGFVQALFEPV